MNRKIQLISAISLLSLGIGSAWAAISTKVDCETMGYTTPLEKCLAVGGSPLFCPFHSVDNPMTLCVKSSCRGYPLKESDLDSKAADGRTIWEHVESYDTCTTSPLEDSEKFYKVVKCKSSSLFQNDICDVGCLAERYPYDSHQGNIAGDMRKCEDSIGTGEHYGYETCNDGWEGGWKLNKTGRCVLSACDTKSFPYVSDPNAEFYRGTTRYCLVGGNPYYRYSDTDELNNSEKACGKINDYTLVNSVCQKQCIFSNCTKDDPSHEVLADIAFEYNNWSCKLETEDCRVGDQAVFNIDENEVPAGIVVHLPSSAESSQKVTIIANDYIGSYVSSDLFDFPLKGRAYTECREDQNGKYNSNFMIAYKKTKPDVKFPAFSRITGEGDEENPGYAPAGCVDNSVCGKGEWYMASCGELYDIYKERFILYNVFYDNRFIQSLMGSSTESTMDAYNLGVEFSGGTIHTGYSDVYAAGKQTNYKYSPMLTFKLK